MSGDTHVLVRKGSGAYTYPAGANFPDADVAMAMPQCGPLRLEWPDDQTLQIVCDHCGRHLQDADMRVDQPGDLRILYSNFIEDGTTQ